MLQKDTKKTETHQFRKLDKEEKMMFKKKQKKKEMTEEDLVQKMLQNNKRESDAALKQLDEIKRKEQITSKKQAEKAQKILNKMYK